MKTHTKVSPSRSEQFWNCPGSLQLCDKVPPREDTIFMKDGRNAHALGEHCLKNQIAPVSFIEDYMINDEGEEFLVTEDMANAVQVYYDTVMTDLQNEGLPVSYLDVEREFQLDIDEEARGTNDAGFCTPGGVLYLYDYKHGAGKAVDAEENKQGMYYACGKAQECIADRIIIKIIQPRCKEGDPVKVFETTMAELDKFKEELRIRILATRDPNAKRFAGKHCVFCQAKGICPEYRGAAITASVPALSKEVVTLPVPATITEEALLANLAKFEDFCDKVEDLRKEIHLRALDLAKAGKIADGYKLIQKEGNRKWVDEERVVATFSDRLGKDLWKHTLITPAQLEKKLKSDKSVKTEVERLTERPLGDFDLVKAGNSRGKEVVFNTFVPLGGEQNEKQEDIL